MNQYQLDRTRNKCGVPLALIVSAIAVAVGSCFADEPQASTSAIVERLERIDYMSRGDGSKFVDQLREEGRLLSAKSAKDLEKKLELNPKDLHSRVLLMGYQERIGGRHPSSLGPYGQLILGIINHHPGSILARSTGYWLLYREGRMGDGKAWAKGSQLWLELVESHPMDAEIIGNAGIYHFAESFHPSDQLIRPLDRSLMLLKRAYDLDPENPIWPWHLGSIYSLKAQKFGTPDDQRQPFAREALKYYEKSLALNGMPKIYVLGAETVLAQVAFQAGDLEKARTYATNRLNSVRTEEGWQYGNAVHHMNVILGRIALRKGNRELAKHHLLESGKAPSSLWLVFTGPNFKFAGELLEKGEQSIVLDYLELVGDLWANPERMDPDIPNRLKRAKEIAEQLQEWKQEILDGKIPQDKKWQ